MYAVREGLKIFQQPTEAVLRKIRAECRSGGSIVAQQSRVGSLDLRIRKRLVSEQDAPRSKAGTRATY